MFFIVIFFIVIFFIVVFITVSFDRPGYQPRAAYDMIERFLQKQEFDITGQIEVPDCSECSGVGPFAGAALPTCSK